MTRVVMIPSKGTIRVGFLTTAVLQLFFILTKTVNCEKLQVSKNVSPMIKVGDQWRLVGTKAKIADCTDHAFKIPNVDLKLLGSGYTKSVYELPDGRAIKRIAFFGPSITNCLENEHPLKYNQANCLKRVAETFIIEIYNFLLFQNDSNIPKLHAYCIPYNFIKNAPDIGIIIDGGHPLNAILLAQIDWHARVKMLDKILKFLKRHEQFYFRDIRRQQFVLINNHPFLVDLDDISMMTSNTKEMIKRIYSGFVDGFFFHNQPKSAENTLLQLQQSYNNSSLDFAILSQLTNELTSF